MMHKIVSAIAILMLLTSCSKKMKEKIGLEEVVPNEMEVTKQKPLYIPPHYELPEIAVESKEKTQPAPKEAKDSSTKKNESHKIG